MSVRGKSKEGRKKCEVGILRVCNGVAVRRLTGPKEGDPKLWRCLGCQADLRRGGVKLKEIE